MQRLLDLQKYPHMIEILENHTLLEGRALVMFCGTTSWHHCPILAREEASMVVVYFNSAVYFYSTDRGLWSFAISSNQRSCGYLLAWARGSYCNHDPCHVLWAPPSSHKPQSWERSFPSPVSVEQLFTSWWQVQRVLQLFWLPNELQKNDK